MSDLANNVASTPAATAAQAESREGLRPAPGGAIPPPPNAAGGSRVHERFEFGDGLTRAVRMAPYERKPTDPIYRPLRIFTRDPATSVLAGAISVVNVPFEPLKPGPEGSLFRIEGLERPLDLNSRDLLMSSGIAPTMSDDRFSAQMVYAVCSSVY